MDGLGLIRARVQWCEAEGVSILCCPEAILGGLADKAEDPAKFATQPIRQTRHKDFWGCEECALSTILSFRRHHTDGPGSHYWLESFTVTSCPHADATQDRDLVFLG
jgi:hypothetical protein